MGERKKKEKVEDDIVLKLPEAKAPEEESEESEEESDEEEKVEEQAKKKLSLQDLKPAVKIKAAFEPEEQTPRRKRKEPEEPAEELPLFDEKPKVQDEFSEKEKKEKGR